jgi:hypothetical protein
MRSVPGFPLPSGIGKEFSFEIDFLFVLHPGMRHTVYLTSGCFLGNWSPEDSDRVQVESPMLYWNPAPRTEHH